MKIQLDLQDLKSIVITEMIELYCSLNKKQSEINEMKEQVYALKDDEIFDFIKHNTDENPRVFLFNALIEFK